MPLPRRYQRKEQARRVAAVFLLGVIACLGTLVPKTTSSSSSSSSSLSLSLSLPLPLAFTFAFATARTSRTTAPNQKCKSDRTFHQKLFRVSPLFSTDDSVTTATNTVKANAINGASSAQVSFESSETVGVEKSTNTNKSSLLLDKFRKASNFASLLCVLDCTLLPIVTVGLPLLGVVNLSTAGLQVIDKLGHSLALFFVLPVGSLTTAVNYWGHRKKWIASMALFGIALVGIANSHWHLPHTWPALVTNAIHNMQSCGCHPSIWHRLANVGGCAMLLGSNYLSQKQQEGCAAHAIAGTSDCCGHDH